MVSSCSPTPRRVARALHAHGRSYEDPRLVLFRDSQPTACGHQQSAVGPFYCPGDRSVYIDLAFYDDLRQLGAPAISRRPT
jgi:predicted metalloprotease